MKLPFVLISLCISQIALSQNQISDFKKMNLKGKVISINEKETKSPSVIADGGQFNSRIENTFYTFNKAGFITEKKNSTNNNFNSKEKLYYNSLNQVSKIENYDSEDHLKDYGNYETEYDKNGEISKTFDGTTSSNYKSEVVTKLDNKLITEYSFEGNAYVKTAEKLKNKKGEIIEHRLYSHDKLHIETFYSYNDKGYQLKYIFKEYWNGKVHLNSQQFVYNKNNDIVKIISLDKDNNTLNEENFSYEYDKQGNWISKQTHGDYIIRTDRDIKYGK